MKHIKAYKLFESKEDIDYISLILSNLSDTAPIVLNTSLDDNLIVFDLNVTNKDYDEDEMLSAIGRLEDEGWTLLNKARDGKKTSYDNITLDDTIYCSVIKTSLLNNLKSKGIKLWNDLQWNEWDLNKSTRSNCLHSKFKSSKGEMISIVDGTGKGNNQINWIEIYNFEHLGAEARFSNPVEAEVYLIKIQM
jgi:hypothetical protein